MAAVAPSPAELTICAAEFCLVSPAAKIPGNDVRIHISVGMWPALSKLSISLKYRVFGSSPTYMKTPSKFIRVTAFDIESEITMPSTLPFPKIESTLTLERIDIFGLSRTRFWSIC